MGGQTGWQSFFFYLNFKIDKFVQLFLGDPNSLSNLRCERSTEREGEGKWSRLISLPVNQKRKWVFANWKTLQFGGCGVFVSSIENVPFPPDYKVWEMENWTMDSNCPFRCICVKVSDFQGDSLLENYSLLCFQLEEIFLKPLRFTTQKRSVFLNEL